jgi:hypothetical protein
MSKVLGAVILHYGKDYFWHSLKSIVDHVDEIVVFYTAKPSHGTSTDKKNPDTMEELKAIADHFNCTWIQGQPVIAENRHRQQYVDYGRKNGFDQILIVDSDEVHISERIPELLEAARNESVMNICVKGSQWLTPWRSFNEYVTDGFAPVRVLNLKKAGGEAHVDKGFIYHMGYCISDELMEYKISCHGHRGDFEKNRGWLNDKWHGYIKGVTKYLHPATEAYWIETKPLDKTTLPQILKDHPNFNKDRVL